MKFAMDICISKIKIKLYSIQMQISFKKSINLIKHFSLIYTKTKETFKPTNKIINLFLPKCSVENQNSSILFDKQNSSSFDPLI